MTIKRLEQYSKIKDEIAELERRLRTLQPRYVSDVVSASSKTDPYQKRNIVISGYANTYSDTRNKLTALLDNRKKRLEDEELRIEEFIDSIDDSEIRRIVRYRYIDGLSWEQVAARISSYATKDSVRKLWNRFFQKISSLSVPSVF